MANQLYVVPYGGYPITTPDGSQLALDSLNHTYTYNDGGQILTDTVIAICRFYTFENALGNTIFLPGIPYYYTQTYTYDGSGNLTNLTQWTQGEPYIPVGSGLITQSGKFFTTQEGQIIATQ